MICPICDVDVQPNVFPTGLRELLAGRIHLAKDHGIYKHTDEAAELRVAAEEDNPKHHDIIWVDVDNNEEWLEQR